MREKAEMADIKKAALILSIAVFFAILTILGAELFITEPRYEDYCVNSFGPTFPAYAIEKQREANFTCPELVVPQSDSASCSKTRGYIEYNYSGSSGCPTGYYCNDCSAKFEDARKPYNRAMFLATVAAGSLALVFGVLAPLTIESIGAGFMYGGIITMVYGTIRYADWSDKAVRFFSIAIELALIIWATYSKIERGKEGKDPKNGTKKRKL